MPAASNAPADKICQPRSGRFQKAEFISVVSINGLDSAKAFSARDARQQTVAELPENALASQQAMASSECLHPQIRPDGCVLVRNRARSTEPGGPDPIPSSGGKISSSTVVVDGPGVAQNVLPIAMQLREESASNPTDKYALYFPGLFLNAAPCWGLLCPKRGTSVPNSPTRIHERKAFR